MGKLQRWRVCISAALLVAAISGSVGPASAQEDPIHVREAQAARALIAQLTADDERELDLSDLNIQDLGPPPWTSFVPNRDPVAIEAWKMLAARFPSLGVAAPAQLARQTVTLREAEPGDTIGLNDTPETGELIPGFGTGEGDTDFARVQGNIFVPPPPPDCESVEDDGAIQSASPIDGEGPSEVHLCSGVLGDGPHGETTGDFDFYSYGTVEEGQVLIIEVVADRNSGEQPETTVAIYDEFGEQIALQDQSGFQYLEANAPHGGEYFAMIAGRGNLPDNPFDSSSGNGATTTGPYEVFIVSFPPPCGSEEDDGAIQDANDVSATVAEQGIAFCDAFLGDGPHGETTGDFDFYFMGEIQAGSVAIVDLFAFQEPLAGAFVALYNNSGQLIASVADDGAGNDFIEVPIEETGLYFGMAGSGIPQDPFNSGSGESTPVFGPYGIAVGAFSDGPAPEYRDWRLRAEDHEPPEEPPSDGEPPAEEEPPPPSDVDFYLVELEAGDVISAAFEPEAFVSIHGPDGELIMGSPGFSASFIYPLSSPIRHLGDSAVDHVAREAGTYAIGISEGFGPYDGEFRVARPGRSDAAGEDAQIIFLDFDGASVSPSIFDPFSGSDEVALSPLSDFMAGWGLSAADENAVIDEVIIKVNAELRDHLRMEGTYGDRDSSGTPGEFDVEIRNSRDHGDLWGQPNVSRVIVGGTINELGFPTVGIAQSIDPGNLESEETAVVLLDLLSEDAEVDAPTINLFDWVAPYTKQRVVGESIGVIVAHEIGHFIGNWHTETGNESYQIMDAGGDLAGTFGVGPDLTFGTDDDIAVHFGSDIFNSFEGFFGVEDTEARSGFAMATGPAAPSGSPSGVSVDDLANNYKFTESHAQVLRLYAAYFGRQPDVAGANYWVGVFDDGSTLEDISGFFTLSKEFENAYAGTTNTEYMTRVYQNVLGRDFDQSGFEYWLNLLDNGTLDRGGVVMWISLNPEFVDANLFGGK